MWLDGRTENLSISIGAQQNFGRGEGNWAEDFESEWEKDGLTRICEGCWVRSRRFCTCMATGRPCHGMMEELVHRLTSDVQTWTTAACCGLHEQVTPLLHDISRPDIVIVRRVEKLRKTTIISVVCMCVCVCVCVYVFVRLSVSVCLSAWNFSVPTGRNFMKFDNFGFFENLFGEFGLN